MGRLLTLLRQKGEFSPLDLPGLALWLDASDTSTITHDTGAVSQWDDKSGNARHVAQATAASQPATGAATVNGLNALSFGGNDFLQTASASSVAQPFTLMMVLDSNITTSIAFDGLDATTRVVCGPYATDGILLSAGTTVYATPAVPRALTLFTLVVNGASSTVFVNGVERSIANPGSNPLRLVTVGANYLGGGGLDGEFCELLVCGGALSTANREAAEAYLTRWGVTLA